eukprot:gene27311-biopygen17818
MKIKGIKVTNLLYGEEELRIW